MKTKPCLHIDSLSHKSNDYSRFFCHDCKRRVRASTILRNIIQKARVFTPTDLRRRDARVRQRALAAA
jgi:uncharacterized protein YlaI